jgi:uncharacterized protein with ParB-like and HNH nuclease domain
MMSEENQARFQDEEDRIEGEETLDPAQDNDSELSPIYPANVKVDRDVYSVYELKRRYEQGRIILDPDYQREDVWKRKQKSELIESVLMGIPLPVMYFAQDKYGTLQVIDGRQRLTALFEFLDNKFTISSIPILRDLKGKRFKDLAPLYQAKLEDYQMVIYVIKPQTPDRVKFDIFERVNRRGTQLNKQEMRNALYQGKSTKLLKELSNYEEFLKATGNAINKKRMKDRYLILRFLAFYLWKNRKLIYNGKIVEYKSDIDDFLGKTMEIINNMNDEAIDMLRKVFVRAMKNSFEILGKDGFRIPGEGRKRPINMALFESLSYLMSHEKVEHHRGLVKRKIEALFNDEEFIQSLTEKVDSSTSVNVRFSKMDEILEDLP